MTVLFITEHSESYGVTDQTGVVGVDVVTSVSVVETKSPMLNRPKIKIKPMRKLILIT